MPQLSTEDELRSSVIKPLFGRLMPFLLLLYIVAYLDRINVGFAALQMKQQLHFSDAVYGLGAGIFFIGYFVFQLPSNLLLQKIGPRRWIAFLMVIWGIISCGMMFVAGTKSFYTLRFLLGAAEAGFFPGVLLYMRSWFPSEVRARTVALFMTAGPISGVIGGPISGALLNLDTLHSLAGWQWLFLIEGLPAILLGITVYFVLQDSPERVNWLSPEQREWLLTTLKKDNTPVAASKNESTFSAFLNPKIWLLALVYLGLNTGNYGISLWLPTVLHRASTGLGNVQLGFLTTIPYLCGVIFMILTGLHSDRTRERALHVAVPAFIAAVALFSSGHFSSVTALVTCLTLAYAGVQCMNGPVWALANKQLTGATAAAGIALVNSIGNLGGGLGPYLIGFVRGQSGDFSLALAAVGAVLLVASIISAGMYARPASR